jgi:hypothetical protein
MLIGTASELKELAKKLQAAVQDQPETSNSDWPPELAQNDISQTENGKASDFVFSIHLETTSAAKPSPNLKSRIAFPLLVGVILIALWQVITWLKGLAT